MKTSKLYSLLLSLLLLLPIAVTSHPSKQSNQQIMQNLVTSMNELEKVLSESQIKAIMELQETHDQNIALLFIDPTETPSEFTDFIKEQGLAAAKAIEIKELLHATLAAKNIPVEHALKFISVMNMYSFVMSQQQQPMNTEKPGTNITPGIQEEAPNQMSLEDLFNIDNPQFNFDANEDTSNLSDAEKKMREDVKEERRKSSILKELAKLGNLKEVVMLNPETQRSEIESLVEKANKSNGKKVSLTNVLKLRELVLGELSKLDVKPEDLKALIDECKTKDLNTFFKQEESIDLSNLLFHDPAADATFFKRFLAKINTKITEGSQPMTLNDLLEWRQQRLAFLSHNGISLDEFKKRFAQEIKEKNSAVHKSIGYALFSSFAYGTAYILKLQSQFTQKAGLSILNKLFGTIIYFDAENKFEFSKMSLTARALELLALKPTTNLYLEEHLEALIKQTKGTPMLQLGYNYLTQLHWAAKPILAVIPYVVPGTSIALNGNLHQQIPHEALAKHLGPTAGAVTSLLTSRVAPALIWMGILRHRHPAIFQTIKDCFTKDKHNVLSQTGIGLVPLAFGLTNPLDKKLQNLAPKNNVFLRTFLGQRWVYKFTEILYKSGLSAAAWTQLNNPAEAKFNVVFGNEQTRQIVELDLNIPENKKHKTWFEWAIRKNPGVQKFLRIKDYHEDETKEITMIRVPDTTTGGKSAHYHVTGSFAPELLTPERIALQYTTSTWNLRNNPTSMKVNQIGLDFSGSAKEAGFKYFKKSVGNLATRGLITAGLTSAAIANTKNFAKPGALVSRWILDSAVKYNVITKRTHDELIKTADGVKTLIRGLIGLLGILTTYKGDPTQLFLNPEGVAGILEKVMEDPSKLGPAGQEMQHMTHQFFASMLYDKFAKRQIHNLGKTLNTDWLKQDDMMIDRSTPTTWRNSAELRKLGPIKTPCDLGNNAKFLFTYAGFLPNLIKILAIVLPWSAFTAYFEDEDETAKPAEKTFAESFEEEQPLEIQTA